MTTRLYGQRRYCIVYAGPKGAGIAGPITKAGAEHKAQQLLAAGASSAEVMVYEPWASVRERYGIPRTREAYRQEQYHRERMANGGEPIRLIDATAFTRRWQALMSLGYSLPAQEELGGFQPWMLRNIRGRHQERILWYTDDRMRRLYEKLWDVPAVGTTKNERMSIARTIAHAKRNNYAPPMAWDDDTIGNPEAEPNLDVEGVTAVDWVLVDRALAGQPVRLNTQEKRFAARVMKSKGVSKSQAARLLGLNGTQVKEYYKEEAA